MANAWTVDRGQGGPHPFAAPVMSTPLRTLTSAQLSDPPAQNAAGYFVGNQAQICKASASHDNSDGTWSAWFIDIGDGWVKISQ